MQKLYKAYCKIEEIICGIGFFTIVLLTFSSAFFRLFKMPLIWADDVSQLLFAWVAFLGADVALRYNRLVGVDIVVKKFSPRVRKIFQVVVYLIIITIMTILFVYGIILALDNLERNFQSIYISYSWVTISVPVGGLLIIITSLTKLRKIFIHFNDVDYNLHDDVPAADNERQIV